MAILATTEGVEIILDDDDFVWASKFKWHLNRDGYALRNTSRKDGQRYKQSLHREIMGLKKGDPQIVDHINCNKLDNRRENLRFCSKSQNTMNRGPAKNNKSGYKGVSFDVRNNKYKAQIKMNGKVTFLGNFDCPIEAYAAYKLVAEEVHGDFANFTTKTTGKE